MQLIYINKPFTNKQFLPMKTDNYYILKLHQQDATLYDIRLLLSLPYMFRAGFPPIITSSKTVHAAMGTCQTCFAVTASLSESFRLA